MLHHGREIQCVALIPGPYTHSPLAIITGGEDSMLRRLLYGGAANSKACHCAYVHKKTVAIRRRPLIVPQLYQVAAIIV